MNALVFIGWWFGLSLVAGVALGRLLERAALATVPADRPTITGSRAVR